MRRNTGIAVTEAETHRARSSGRPREFDLDAALDAAVTVFWKKGYEGTSLPDLTAAMGINRPSLYAAFGNKEALFRKAVERYLNSVGASVMSALAEPKVRDAMRRYLTAGLCGADSKQPRGCMLINAALACGDKAEPIRQELAGRRSQMECAIRARLERAKKEGEFRAGADVTALAKFIATFQHGLAVQQTGCGRAEELRAAVELAMGVVEGEMAGGKRSRAGK